MMKRSQAYIFIISLWNSSNFGVCKQWYLTKAFEYQQQLFWLMSNIPDERLNHSMKLTKRNENNSNELSTANINMIQITRSQCENILKEWNSRISKVTSYHQHFSFNIFQYIAHDSKYLKTWWRRTFRLASKVQNFLYFLFLRFHIHWAIKWYRMHVRFFIQNFCLIYTNKYVSHHIVASKVPTWMK